MEAVKNLNMYVRDHLCVLCTYVVVPVLRHETERGYQCGRVRWGRAVSLWARSNHTSFVICHLVITRRNIYLNMFKDGSWCWALSGPALHKSNQSLFNNQVCDLTQKCKCFLFFVIFMYLCICVIYCILCILLIARCVVHLLEFLQFALQFEGSILSF